MKDWQETLARFPRHWIWDKQPVYHIGHRGICRGDDGLAFTKTRCGIKLHVWNRETGETYRDRETLMRREFADKFARPCRRCVPQ